MKKKINFYIGVMLFCFLYGNFYNPAVGQASSADIKITSDVSTVTKGDNIFVYITITSESKFGDVEANITYDDDILEYQVGPNVITGSSGFLKLNDRGGSEATKSRKYTLKFEAIKVGTSKIALNGRAMVYDYDTELEMSISSSDHTVDVKAKETASTNAKLKSLKISPAQLEPSFHTDVSEYNVSVGNDVEKLIINAVPEHAKASVSISGNNDLKEGENKIIVKVLAESGAVIEYTINVFREIAPPENTDSIIVDDITVEPSKVHGVFEVVEENNEIYAVFQAKYKLIEPEETITIPEGYIKSTAILNDVSVTAYLKENDLESDFILLYAENDIGKRDFYRYDRIEKTIQRYKQENIIKDEIIPELNEQVENKESEYKDNSKRATLVIGILSILCIILSIICVILYRNRRKKRRR